MVPVELNLRNFLSYGEKVPPLDFTGFSLACLSGPNGHGKSALIDAITWAIWGKSRSSGRTDENLLRIGSTEMRVEITFDLENERYRVIRSLDRTKKGSRTSLDFQVFDPSDETYKILTLSTSTKTQEKINQFLGMTYDTFINSALILQGRANEFSNRTPGERKKILFDILGLERYDQLAEVAKRLARDVEQDLRFKKHQSAAIREEVQKKDEHAAAIEILNEQIGALTQRMEEDRISLNTRRRALDALADIRKSIDQLVDQSNELARDIENLQEQVPVYDREIAEYQNIISRKEKILHDADKFEKFSKENEKLQIKVTQLRSLEADRNRLETEVSNASHALEKDVHSTEVHVRNLREELAAVEKLLASRPEVDSNYKTHQALKEENRVLDKKKEDKEELELALRELESAIQKTETQLNIEKATLENALAEKKPIASELKDYEKKLEQAHRAHAQAQKALDKLEEIKNRGISVAATIKGHTEDISALDLEIKDEHTLLQALLENPGAHCPLCDSVLDDGKRHTIQEHKNEVLKKKKDHLESLRKTVQALEASREDLRKEYLELQTEAGDHNLTSRKLTECEHAVAGSKKAVEEVRRLEEEINKLHNKISFRTFSKQEQKALTGLRQKINQLAYDSGRHKKVREDIESLSRIERQKTRIDDAEIRRQQVTEALPKAEEKLTALNNRLFAEAFAESARKELQTVRRKIQENVYDEARHQLVQAEVTNLSGVEIQVDKLAQAEAKIDGATGRRKKLRENLKTKSAQKRAVEEKLEKMRSELGDPEKLEQEVAEMEGNLADAAAEKERLSIEKGALQNKYETCLEKEKELKVIQSDIVTAAHDHSIYQKLTAAYGKNGIPALIIESAVPELEEEANEILNLLTDGRTHLTFESLRDLKSGDTRETLDIRISDEVGTRDYEMYSGGEAFRTDFAIRIALSKLLARRNGVKLRTLIIDEGFGTQDPQGIDHLIEAIRKISSEFEKILIITHLETLKNEFPVKIEVRKQPGVGSTFTVDM